MATTEQGRGDLARLRTMLGGPATGWLRQRVRERLARGGGGRLAGVVQLRDPDADERMAAMRLVGAPRRPGHSVRVDLGAVEDLLRRGVWPEGLADAVVTLTGPVVDRLDQQASARAAWDDAEGAFAPALRVHPSLAGWWTRWCAAGNLKRAARSELARRTSLIPDVAVSARAGEAPAEETAATSSPASIARLLAADAAACLVALPSAGEPLPLFARRVLGDAHGLDVSRPLGRLALSAISAILAASRSEQSVDDGAAGGSTAVESAGGDGEIPGEHVAFDDSIGARELWAAVGVLLSSVASTVLCLGVPGTGVPGAGVPGTGVPGTGVPGRGGPSPSVSEPVLVVVADATATALGAWRAAGIPVVLTLDQVRSGGVAALPPGEVVHVCENPSVVEVVASEALRRRAANRARPSSGQPRPVLVCTSGQPGAAVLELLRVLTGEGAGLRYHGDFDWAGLRIAATLATRHPWEPWRFGAADYGAAVRAHEEVGAGAEEYPRRILALRGPESSSPWDPDLAESMRRHGLAIEEEEVVDQLVADLLG